MIKLIGNVRGHEVPVTCREAHRKLKDAGAYLLPRRGKGSHEIWWHHLVPERGLTLPCHSDGYELSPGVEKQLNRFLQIIQERSASSQ